MFVASHVNKINTCVKYKYIIISNLQCHNQAEVLKLRHRINFQKAFSLSKQVSLLSFWSTYFPDKKHFVNKKSERATNYVPWKRKLKRVCSLPAIISSTLYVSRSWSNFVFETPATVGCFRGKDVVNSKHP